jgi:Skp family chaperone for outer membrane proteins
MKTLLMAIPLALLPAFLSPAASPQAPVTRPPLAIRYISAQRIVKESADGKAGAARMQTLQQQKSGELRTKQQALEATRQQLAQATDNQARTQLQQQEQQQRLDFERSSTQAQADIQAAQRQFDVEIMGKLKLVLDDLAKNQDLQLVVNADTSVLWSAPGLDVTTAVIDRLNAKPATPAPTAPTAPKK